MAALHKSASFLVSKAFVNLGFSILFLMPVIAYFLHFAQHGAHFKGLYHLACILPAIPANYYLGNFFKLISGAKGESVAKKYMEKLPADYHVFENIHLQNEDAECEVDLLVIGENGIFAVEVKNHNGKISGDINDRYWEQEKTGRQGGVYTKNIKNPIRQVKRSVYILSQILERNQLRSWITPLVLFTNQPRGVKVESDEVYTSGEALKYDIEHAHARKNLDNATIGRLTKLLIQESKQSRRTSFMAEVILTKSNAIAVALFVVVISLYSQIPYENNRRPLPQSATTQSFNFAGIRAAQHSI